jgi:hypothetical protein
MYIAYLDTLCFYDIDTCYLLYDNLMQCFTIAAGGAEGEQESI